VSDRARPVTDNLAVQQTTSRFGKLLSGSANVGVWRADKAGCIDEVRHKMHDIESSGGFDARVVQLHEVSCRWNNCQRLSSNDFAPQ
jgi:hypothetical protein